jgi:hypothetical protein
VCGRAPAPPRSRAPAWPSEPAPAREGRGRPWELTGTADARLIGFWTSPVTIGQIDKTTAAVISQTPLPAIAPAGGFAFSFWGGDFWLFTAGNVYQYTPPTATAPSVATYPFTVVGAGVSTCAPLTPPT